jgi:hypothetical protein
MDVEEFRGVESHIVVVVLSTTMIGSTRVVIEGPVTGTEKRPEPDWTTTGNNWTSGSVEPPTGYRSGCSCSEYVLHVDQSQLVSTSCNQYIVLLVY